MSEQQTRTSLTKLVGVDVSGLTDPQTIIDQAGINVPMETVPTYDRVGEKDNGEPLVVESKEFFHLRRSDTHEIYNVVKGKYEVVSTAEMIEPFVTACLRLGMPINTAGMINGGRRLFLTAELPEAVEIRSGDSVTNQVCALIFNDGYGSNSFLPIQFRVACANQLSLMRSISKSLGLKVPHTKNYKSRIDQAMVSVESAIDELNQFNEKCAELASEEFSELDMLGFSFALFPETSVQAVSDAHDEDVGSGRKNAKRERIQDLFKSGSGNQGSTRFDALNAVTEYANHEAYARKIEKAAAEAGAAGKQMVFNRALRNNLIGGTWNNTVAKAIKLLTTPDSKGKLSKFRKFIPKGFKKD